MKLKSKISIALKIILTLFFVGCSKDMLDEKPPNLITTETLYTNLSGFETGLNGLYATARLIRRGLWDGGQYNKDYLIGEFLVSGNDNVIANSENSSGGYSRIAVSFRNELTPNTYFITGVFNWLYQIVNAANTIITETAKPTIDWSGAGGTKDENKNRVIGEARAVRAWAYRHLSNGWGDVPLVLNESLGSTIKTDWERTPVADVRKQIISDLLFAEKNIPVDPALQGKITRGAVQHYLADMYLTIDKPDSALYWANAVINTPQYKLITARYGVNASKPGVPFMDMFTDGNVNRNQGNTEALWVHQFAYQVIGGGGVNTIDIYACRYEQLKVGAVAPLISTVERGGRGSTRASFSQFALYLYKRPDPTPITKHDILHWRQNVVGDGRLWPDDRMSPYVIRWFYRLNNATDNAPYASDKLPSGYHYGDTIWTSWTTPILYGNRPVLNWPWSRKIAIGVNPQAPNTGESYGNQIIVRLAETYLIKAEAQFKLNDMAGAAATINVIRARAHADPITASNVTLDFILDERSRELAFEEDRRWTLLRTNKWIERTQLYNTNGGAYITDRDKLFPIPQTVIDANLTKIMPQNPGY